MDLRKYFEKAEGIGILATSDSDGSVDIAIYAKPEVVNDSTIAFVMKERLSHQNLRTNLNAAYMFIEKGEGYKGQRLYLTKLREEINASVVQEFIKRQPVIADANDDSTKFLVYFHVENAYPLVGEKK
ncbi:MAG: pyridoxamine 5'-phosphate oxidase family protein [Sedimentisphaerales bacterium]|nr:pyridoxamine 5'-phosphate oxidase family protein [Sedimentisphaerales bacterium]